MKWRLRTAAIALAPVLCACGPTQGTGPGEAEATGTVHLSLSGTSLSTIVVRDVFDHDRSFLLDCTLKDHPLEGEAFCDELLVLPPGVYEIVVQSQDPSCRSEQDHYKVKVTAGETVEQPIELICGEKSGGLDVIAQKTERPVVERVDFTFARSPGQANKFICVGGDDVEVTVTVTDSDTACGVLFANHEWQVDGSASNLDPPIIGEDVQVGPEGECRFTATLSASGPEADYGLTLAVSDGDHPASFTFPVHLVQCPPSCDRGDTTVAYNALPFGVVDCPKPSWGFEATTTNEFGDGVQLAAGSTELGSLKVLFSSYACQSGHWNTGDCQSLPGATFNHPITAKLYSVADCSGVPCPGALLATEQLLVTFPYRPSADPVSCPDVSNWINPVSGLCQASISKLVTFTFPTTVMRTLPAQVIWTVAFDTSHSGYNPIGEGAACSGTSGGCPYDSLNVGVRTFPGSPYSGVDVEPDIAFLSVDGSPLSRGSGWTPYKPLGEIITQ